ncbi:MAG: hypothetical protein SGI99_00710 [Pseudomonadota bacterium]|nr:hypothetical protein [Pseudomonadota bacterium]
MKHVRDLLMDCRIEMRQHVREFHKTDLCKRIDDARDAMLHGPVASANGPTVSVEGADRVAHAWQAAAEDIKLTAPAFYDLLAKKVALRLAALPPEAPPAPIDAEISAVQDVRHAGDTAMAAVGATTAQTAAIVSEADQHVPSAEVLTSIAASKRRFTEAQREWCVGEAMVRSGFSIDPEEFIARGDNEMARFILELVDE